MTEPFRFRYVREIVGTFVLATLGILVVSIIYAGRAQGWFEEERRFHVELPEDVPTGIFKGSEVFVSGIEVGSVSRTRFLPDNRMVAEIGVRGDMLRFIRTDSKASIRRKLGVAGDAYLDISRGQGEQLEAGGWLTASVDQDLNALLVETVNGVTDSVRYTLVQFNALLIAYTELAESLEDPVEELHAILRKVNGITAGLEGGEGTAGRVLKDPALEEEIRGAVRSINTAAASIQDLMIEVKTATGAMPEVVAQFADMVDQLRETAADVESLVEGLQRHWLVRGVMEEADVGASRLAPAEIQSGVDSQ